LTVVPTLANWFKSQTDLEFCHLGFECFGLDFSNRVAARAFGFLVGCMVRYPRFEPVFYNALILLIKRDSNKLRGFWATKNPQPTF
jgi:hypothetical protein